MPKLLLTVLLMVGWSAMFLIACAPIANPIQDGPGVVAPPPSETEPRVIMITQRAPDNNPLIDVRLSLRALQGDQEVSIPSDLASLNDSRCAAVPGSNLASCALGDLAPGEAAPPVEVTVAPGVTLQCNSAAISAGELPISIPLPCRRVGF